MTTYDELSVAEFGSASEAEVVAWLDLRNARTEPVPGSEGIAINKADVLVTTNDVGRAVTSKHLPNCLWQPVIGWTRIIVLAAHESSVGPFKLAVLAVGSRTEGFQQDWVVDVIADRSFDGGGLALPARVGTVDFQSEYSTTTTTIADERGELLRIEQNLSAFDVQRFCYDPIAYPIRRDGGAALGCVSYRPEAIESGGIDRAFRVRSPRPDSLWAELSGDWPITSYTVRCSLNLRWLDFPEPVQMRTDLWPAPSPAAP